MATRLFVGNIPQYATEKDLRSAFSNFGELTKLDVKSKPGEELSEQSKKFAFLSISASNHGIESCIKHFSNEDFSGSRLYVTRARESFLERLQREREQAKIIEVDKETSPERKPAKQNLKVNEKHITRKRKFENSEMHTVQHKLNNNFGKVTLQIGKGIDIKLRSNQELSRKKSPSPKPEKNSSPQYSIKKQDSEAKRKESIKKKLQDFRNKKMIIKTGLTAIDQTQNRKIRFDLDGETETIALYKPKTKVNKGTIFDADDDDGSHINFEIKEQYEGKKGQKVLDLQSRYKSDKRFMLDERFVDGEEEEEAFEDEVQVGDDAIEVNGTDEKSKQLDILQDVLGVAIRRRPQDDSNKKPKLGMLRFDPTQPEHAKFFAPIDETNKETTKKSKKKNKDKQIDENSEEMTKIEENRPEVSKEQFYKVSDTLKEAIAQPTTFSLRSLFGNKESAEEEPKTEDSYIPLEGAKKPKIKNPLEPTEKNPFVYDSSDSEVEDEVMKEPAPVSEPKAVWKENLFFGAGDNRLTDGLAFFNNTHSDVQKERRELKSVMKKRIYNKDRKNQMFQKKIGGRKKTMKKTYRKSGLKS